MKKDIITQDEVIISLEPAPSGLTRLIVYSILNGKRSLVEVVDLTPDECAKLGSALYSVAATDKRRKAAEGAVEFRELEIGQKFRFVNHLPKQICTRVDDSVSARGEHFGKWHNYSTPDGRTAHTSANAKVIPINE